MSTTPRSVRNNNPGNIEHQASFRWQGELAPDPALEPRFARFDTPANGFRALAKNLLGYRRTHNLSTVRQIINRWAPPVENETTAYVAAVARALGVHQDNALDVEQPGTLAALAKAITIHETGGWAPWWRDEDLAAGVAAALDLPVEQAPAPVVEAARPSAAPPPSTPAAGPAIQLPPAQEPRMPFPIVPIVTALLPQIIAAIPELARIVTRQPAPTGEKPTVSERNLQVLEKVGEIVTRATGESTVEGAVRKLQEDAGAREAAQREVRLSFPELMQLAELNEKSTTEARAFAQRMTDSGPMWRALGFGVILAVLAFVVVVGGGWILHGVLQADGTDLQTRGMIIGALIGFVAQVLAYFFGSSASSRSKDQAMVSAIERR
jgi:hypothetical protein